MMKYLELRPVQKRQIHGLGSWIVSCIKQPQICRFCTALISMYFELKIYTHVCYAFMYICIYFQNFLKCWNTNFDEISNLNLEAELQKGFPLLFRLILRSTCIHNLGIRLWVIREQTLFDSSVKLKWCSRPIAACI